MILVTEKVSGNSKDKGVRLHFTTKQARLRSTRISEKLFSLYGITLPANRSCGKEVLLVSCFAVCTECTVLHNYSAYKIKENFKVNILYFKTEECCNQEITAVD